MAALAYVWAKCTKGQSHMFLRDAMYRHRARLFEESQARETADGQRSGWWYTFIYDHGALRTLWTNKTQISNGVFRSNQPSPKRLQSFARSGVKTILNLRGSSQLPQYLAERDACGRLGLTLVDVEGLSARAAPSREALQTVLAALKSAERPLVIHCKSGADRTSLVAAMYLLSIENAPVKEARRQLSLRYIHLKWTRAGVLDSLLDHFETAQQTSGISFEDWLNTVYDGAAMQAAFDDATGRA